MNQYRYLMRLSEGERMDITGNGIAEIIYYPFIRLLPMVQCSLQNQEQNKGDIGLPGLPSHVNTSSFSSGAKRASQSGPDPSISSEDPLTPWHFYTIDIFYGSPPQGYNVVVGASIIPDTKASPWPNNKYLLSVALKMKLIDHELINVLRSGSYTCVIGLKGRNLCRRSVGHFL